jgi:hypothetical protein
MDMTSTLSAHFMHIMDTVHKNQNAKVSHVLSFSNGYPLIKLPAVFLKPSKWKRRNQTWTLFLRSGYGPLLRLFNLKNNISILVNYNYN